MPDIHALVDGLRTVYAGWGYPIVFAGALLENTVLLGLLLPGGSLVLLGAMYAHEGTMSLPLVLLLGWAGMVLGTSVDYTLGRLGGHPRLRDSGVMRRLEPGLRRARPFLRRHGAWAFPLAHVMGHIRSFLAITAGASGLTYRRFLLYESPAALLWNVLFVAAGYLLGRNVEAVEAALSRAGLAGLLLALAAFAAYRVLRKRGAVERRGREAA